jgi:hypothetical protein
MLNACVSLHLVRHLQILLAPFAPEFPKKMILESEYLEKIRPLKKEEPVALHAVEG